MNQMTKIDSGLATSFSVWTLQKYKRLFLVNVRLWLVLAKFQPNEIT